MSWTMEMAGKLAGPSNRGRDLGNGASVPESRGENPISRFSDRLRPDAKSCGAVWGCVGLGSAFAQVRRDHRSEMVHPATRLQFNTGLLGRCDESKPLLNRRHHTKRQQMARAVPASMTRLPAAP